RDRDRGAQDARRAGGLALQPLSSGIPARIGSGTPAASPGRPQAGRRDPQHQRPGRRRRPRRPARAPCRTDPLRTALPARGPDAHRHRRPAVTMPMHSRSPRSRLAALALALGFALGTLPVLPLAAQDAAPADGTRAPAMDLRGADLRAFIQDVAVATGTSFIVDPSVQGTVEYTSDHAPEGEELLGVLLAILRGNGLIAVPAGPATYRVIPDDAGAQHPRSAGGAGFGTTVIPLARIDARVAAETLKPLVGRGGVVLASPQGNSLLVADYSDNLARIHQLVAQIDSDRATIDTVTLRNSSAREVAATVRGLFGVGGEGGGQVLSILPVEGSNSVVVRGDPTVIARVVQMILELDRRAERSGNVRVIELRHASAEQLLPVL